MMKTKQRRISFRLADRITMRLEPALLEAVIRFARTNGYGKPSVVARAALTSFLKKEGYLTNEDLLRDPTEPAEEARKHSQSSGKGS